MQMKPQKFLEMLNLNFISLILEHRVFYSMFVVLWFLNSVLTPLVQTRTKSKSL